MKKYFSFLKIIFINQIDYRQETIMGVLVGLLYFAGQAIFWNAIFRDHETVRGFTYMQILTYYIVARVLSDIVDSRTGFEMIDEIMNGKVTNLLVKPVRIQFWYLFREIGRIGPQYFSRLVIYSLIFILLAVDLHFTWVSFIVMIISIIPAFLISFSLNYLIGLVAFKVTNAKSMVYAMQRIFAFLSGALLPLAFFPDLARKILLFTPFEYIFNLPMKILFRQIGAEDILLGLMVQFAWVLVLWVLCSKLFNHLIKHNESVGI